MRTVLRLAAPIAVVAAFTSPSLAADYDPPIIIDEAPEVVPVEVGSGWYLRGDVGYTISNGADNGSGTTNGGVSFDDDTKDFFGGAGFGYHFTDYFRADFTGAYLQREEATFGDLRGSLKTDMGYGMATGYVDLGTVVGITPYIGAGAGFVYSRTELSGALRNGADGLFGSYSDDDFSFAYTLNAGLAYRITENLSLDVGYQYLNAPDAKHFNGTEPNLTEEGFDMHQVKVGLRYDLW